MTARQRLGDGGEATPFVVQPSGRSGTRPDASQARTTKLKLAPRPASGKRCRACHRPPKRWRAIDRAGCAAEVWSVCGRCENWRFANGCAAFRACENRDGRGRLHEAVAHVAVNSFVNNRTEKSRATSFWIAARIFSDFKEKASKILNTSIK